MSRIFSTLFQNKNFQSVYGNLLVACLGLLNFSLLARSLTKEEFGHWVIFISGSTMLEMIRAGIVQTPLIKFTSGIQNQRFKCEFISTGFIIGLGITMLISGLVLISQLPGINTQTGSGYGLFLKWFPLLFLVSFPRNFYLWNAQGERNFVGIFKSQFATFGLFSGYVIAHYLKSYPVHFLPIAYITSQGINSIWLLFSSNLFRIKYRYFSKKHLHSILNYGKFSMGTMIGGNLLKTADTLIIGLIMNASSVAVFSIALRLTEVFDLLIRSLANNLFPQLSAAANQKKAHTFHLTFKKYTVGVTLIFILIMFFTFYFAEVLIAIVAGSGYFEAVFIFRILVCGCLFIPFYRFSGVALDAINKPAYNFYRILFLLSFNVLGDFLVLLFFQEVWCVAMLTVFVFFLGMLSGMVLTKRAGLNISLRDLIKYPVVNFLRINKVG